ncbi:MAG: PQQ-binding-like beta-propeller repeat protein [Candidatus Coatesbacteria bacterium]|nr:PQQ-binding-like beta-propeller repeat protein [Candidatus Coatesbacteria bacterium]
MRILIMILVGFSLVYGEHFWTNWRGNNRQDGLSPCIGPREPYFINSISLKPACDKSNNMKNDFKRPTIYPPHVAAVISEDSTLYVRYCDDGNSYLLSIKNDQLQWREQFGDREEQNICIDDEGILYFPYEDYYLVAYNAKQRYIIWQKGETNRGSAVSTFVDKGIVYLITIDEYVLAYNSKSGELLWKEVLKYPVYISAYGDNGSLYYESSNCLVEFRSNKTYRTLPAVHSSLPSIAKDGTLYSVFDKKLYAITPDMNIKWSSAAMEDTTEDFNPCAIDNAGNIICSSYQLGNIYKFASNGSFLWKVTVENYPNLVTIDDEDKIFFGNFLNLYCLKPDGSKMYSINTDDLTFYAIPGPARRLYIFCYNDDNNNDYVLIYGGKEGFKERKETAKQIPAKIDIYPNPFKDKLTVNSTSEGAIYNIVGQSIQSFNKGKQVLDTQSWEQGVYIIKSGSSTKRIIKIR